MSFLDGKQQHFINIPDWRCEQQQHSQFDTINLMAINDNALVFKVGCVIGEQQQHRKTRMESVIILRDTNHRVSLIFLAYLYPEVTVHEWLSGGFPVAVDSIQ